MRTRRMMISLLALAATTTAAAGCGSRVETTGTASSTTRPALVTTAPVTNQASTTAAAGQPVMTATTAPGPGPTTTAAGAPTSLVTSTTAAAVAGNDLADFCEKTKLLDLSDVTAFEAYDTNAAVKLVFTFDKIQKAAPAELIDGFKAMRPLVEELNKKVKAGEVHDRESLQAWLIGLNDTNKPALEQWIEGQAKVVPFIQANCA